jgi:hypothetical protein
MASVALMWFSPPGKEAACLLAGRLDHMCFRFKIFTSEICIS